MSEVSAPVTPRHLWIVGIIAVLWNLMGALDYTMMETKNAWYLGNFSPEQVAFYQNYPAWMVAFWALAVWGGLLGSVLLLMRKKLAVNVFLVSFICMLVSMVSNLRLSGAADMITGSGIAFTIAIFLISLFLYLYSRAMTRGRVLR